MKGVGRIKRSVLKNDNSEGGLNVTDVECLDKSVKLRQYQRACETDHPVSIIQKYCMEQLEYESKIEREYYRLTSKEVVTRVAQITINIMCDRTRELIWQNSEEAILDDKSIAHVAGTCIGSYFLRKKMLLINSTFAPIRRNGI